MYHFHVVGPPTLLEHYCLAAQTCCTVVSAGSALLSAQSYYSGITHLPQCWIAVSRRVNVQNSILDRLAKKHVYKLPRRQNVNSYIRLSTEQEPISFLPLWSRGQYSIRSWVFFLL